MTTNVAVPQLPPSINLGVLASITTAARATSVYTAYTGGPLYARQMPSAKLGTSASTPTTPATPSIPTVAPSTVANTAPVVAAAPSGEAVNQPVAPSTPGAPIVPTVADAVVDKKAVPSVRSAQNASASKTTAATAPSTAHTAAVALQSAVDDLTQTVSQVTSTSTSVAQPEVNVTPKDPKAGGPVAGHAKTSTAISAKGENTLKGGPVPANNNSTGVTPEQRSGVKPTVGQSAEADAPASVDTVKTTQPDMDPNAGGVAQERGKKTEATTDAAASPETTKTGVESPSVQASQPAKSLSQEERVALVRQIADQVSGSSLKTGHNQVTVRLHPDDWGSVNVRISVTPASQAGGSAQVTAHLVAESPSVKAALDSNMNELRKALAGAGMHLQDAVVSIQAASSAAQSGSTGSGAGNGQHHHSGSWDGGSQTMSNTGGQQSQGGFASFTGGGQGREGQSRPGYQTASVDAVDAPVPSTPTPAKVSGRLDTRA